MEGRDLIREVEPPLRRQNRRKANLTVFDLCDVPHHDLRHLNLDHLAPSHHRELLLLLDAVLEATELLFFAPVVEGRHQDHADHRQQDGGALNPAGLRLALVVRATRRFAAVCTQTTGTKGSVAQKLVTSTEEGVEV